MPDKQSTLGNPALQMAAMELARRRAEKKAAKEAKQIEQQEIEGEAGLSPAIQAGQHGGDAARTVKWVAAGIGGGVILLLLARWVYKSTVRQNIFDKSDDSEKAEHFIKEFEAAFNPDTPFGLGTDEEHLRDIVLEVPHFKLWEEIKRKWRASHGNSLLDEIAGEVSGHMQDEIDAIISQMPRTQREADERPADFWNDSWLMAHAERINAATKYEWLPGIIGGTDTPAIYSALRQLPSFAALCRLNWLYREKYGIKLVDHLWDELTWGEIDEVQKLIKDEYPDARHKDLNHLFFGCSRPQDL